MIALPRHLKERKSVAKRDAFLSIGQMLSADCEQEQRAGVYHIALSRIFQSNRVSGIIIRNERFEISGRWDRN